MSTRRQARAGLLADARATGSGQVPAESVRGRLIRRHEERAARMVWGPGQAWHLAHAARLREGGPVVVPGWQVGARDRLTPYLLTGSDRLAPYVAAEGEGPAAA